ncbi:unnamed protein product [Caenorhabditis angaria]|uniref:Uncharacterized protein n=1 Tax=Caenorhabditis angaria TaxID=860376 RepID=A0A9P1MUA1_9PELO|nr:unnamed protein product [Caenorhabditis angaria]
MIRVENDRRDEVFQLLICSDFTDVDVVFPVVYTITNIARFRDLFLCCYSRGNRENDQRIARISSDKIN